MKRTATTLMVLIVSQAASAQSTSGDRSDSFLEPTLSQLGAYLTVPVGDRYRRTLAEAFLKGAPRAGFNPSETKIFADSIIRGDLRVIPGGEWGFIVPDGRDPNGPIVPADPGSPKVSYLRSLVSVKMTIEFLEKYSTIKLIVKPAPPRDYHVVVNGEPCPATDAGVYKVLPGESIVNATRPDKPKCEWRGSIAPGAVQEVDCSL
jgi:hypothetical protein